VPNLCTPKEKDLRKKQKQEEKRFNDSYPNIDPYRNAACIACG